MNITGRQEAIAQGLKRYCTGEACKHGHVGERLVSTRACLVCINTGNAKWREANRDKAYASVQQWRQKNRHKAIEYHQRKSREDGFRMRESTRKAVGKALRGNKAGRSWEILVGYTLHDLIQHMEKQFVAGMTWANYGEWHIDHITPQSVFGTSDEEVKKCWALGNLRPLWASENCSKRNSMHFLI